MIHSFRRKVGNEMGNEELKKCPFCDGEAGLTIDYDSNEQQGYLVECQNCFSKILLQRTKDDAITAWNRRGK